MNNHYNHKLKMMEQDYLKQQNMPSQVWREKKMKQNCQIKLKKLQINL